MMTTLTLAVALTLALGLTGPASAAGEGSRDGASPRDTVSPVELTPIEGRVVAVKEPVATLVTRGGATVAVDLSAVPGNVEQVLRPGREVTVFGVMGPSGIVRAYGVVFDYL